MYSRELVQSPTAIRPAAKGLNAYIIFFRGHNTLTDMLRISARDKESSYAEEGEALCGTYLDEAVARVSNLSPYIYRIYHKTRTY